MRVGKPIQLQNYDEVIAKIHALRNNPRDEKTTKIFSRNFKLLANKLNHITAKIGLQRYVVLQSGIGNANIKVTLKEIAILLKENSHKTIYKNLKEAGGAGALADQIDQIFAIPQHLEPVEEQVHSDPSTPKWFEMHLNVLAANKTEFNQIKKEELIKILNTLEADWNQIKKYGQWDLKRCVLHLRRKEINRPWTLPRSVEIHYTEKGHQIYVLHKGNSTQKLGVGGFKEVARSVNLISLKSYVHATIDIEKKATGYGMSEKELIRFIKREIELQSRFKDDHEFVTIAGWNKYTDKDGSRKIAITLEFCNGGELFDSTIQRNRNTGKLIDENIDNLMQVITDLFQMLVKLKRKNIINRDIKLENIFLHVDENNRVRAKMSDFGLAWTQTEAIWLLKQDKYSLSGSWDYVPPEYATYAFEPEKRSGFSTHTWQMGLILFSLLTGGVFDLEQYIKTFDPNKINEEEMKFEVNKWLVAGINSIPSCLNDKPEHIQFFRKLLLSMLKKDPDLRPSPEELLQRLETFKTNMVL